MFEHFAQQSVVFFHPAVIAVATAISNSKDRLMNESEDGLNARMRSLRIREEDLEETFIRGTGAGGQKINKTSSTVVLRHVPTGIEVRCQQERSQSQNRLLAREELCQRIAARRDAEKLELKNEKEKARRQNRPRPRSLKKKLVKSKRHRSGIKQNRGRPARED
jgi:protein subunit release factor B